MDRKITVRFFKVSKSHKVAPNFEVALENAHRVGPTASQRERDVFGSTIRLEQLCPNGSFLDGEVVRKQTENIPSEAHDEGLSPLALKDGGGLGHSIAFRYSPSLGVIALQFDNRAVSINKLVAYVRVLDPAHDYVALPLVRRDAWERYNRGRPSIILVEIAAPSELQEVEGEVGSVIASAKRLAEVSKAPVITIAMKMGHSKGSLAQRTVDGLLDYFTKGKGSTHDVRKLEVKNRSGDGPADTIDFLEDFLGGTMHLKLPGNDPNVNFQNRRNYLERCFNEHFDYIRRLYGG